MWVPIPAIVPRSHIWRHVVLIGGLLLIAVNLRPAITSLAPLAERMHADGISLPAIGMQTTVPLVLFGLVGAIVGGVGNRIGFARALGAGLLLLSAGCFLRPLAFSGTLLESIVGSILIGAGIAFGNVLLPGMVKSRYPNHVGLMTSLYSTAMNLGAALGIAAAVPLANSLSGGWRAALGVWGYAALLPFLVWLPQLLRTPTVRSQGNPIHGMFGLFRNARAWQVTAYMGLQSLLFYSSVAWLPTLLQVRGMSEPTSAGWATAMQVCGCAASLTIPTLAGRARSQSAWAAACALISVLAILGIVWMPLSWVGWAAIGLGLGLNASFGICLLVIAMRSEDAATAGNLSSMAQAVGYLAAAPFPWLVGWLSTATGSWTLAYGLLAIPALLVAVAGMFAGREGVVRIAWTARRHIGAETSGWQLHVPTEGNRITRYRCGLDAGQRVRLKKDLVVTNHEGAATGLVHRQGEEWVVLTGITSDPVLWFLQADGRRCTWDDDAVSVDEWFERI